MKTVTNYKGFKIDQDVILTSDCYDNYHKIKSGTKFKILRFPVKVWEDKTGNLYFVFGVTDRGENVRCEITEIKEIK